eukprot:TRINITY_DN17996_c0_g1_i2.p1 TRINITY_DN17996_c0_g1~~TRINITY_DN17996_c0_g1_i2.p1  ORF type:complete len:546 (-),score=61.71 TRINITY_DN17996_c0_g1_i2:46-1683(-)
MPTLGTIDMTQAYKEIASRELWAQVFGEREQLRYLEVYCGISQWTEYFFRLVLQSNSMVVNADFADLCSETMAQQNVYCASVPVLQNCKTQIFDGSQLRNLSRCYDIIASVYGLNCIHCDALEHTVLAMFCALAPGGSMVLALADADSINVRDSHAPAERGSPGHSLVSADDVALSLAELGLEFSLSRIRNSEGCHAEHGPGHYLFDRSRGDTSDGVLDGAPYVPTTTSLFLVKRSLLPPCKRVSEDSELYNTWYRLRRSASTLQQLGIDVARGFGRKVATDKELTVLSIGCGDGDIDCSFLAGVAERVDRPSIRFVGLDPNRMFFDTFRHRIARMEEEGTLPYSWLNPTLVEGFFNEATASMLNETFDIVIMSHVIYFLQDRMASLRLALRLLKASGKLVIFVQGPGALPELQRKFTSSFSGRGVDICTASDVERLLSSLQVCNRNRLNFEAFLDVGPFLAGESDGLAVMSFVIDIDLRMASPQRLTAVCNAVRKLTVEEANPPRKGGPFLAEMLSVLTVSPVAEESFDSRESISMHTLNSDHT